VHRAFTIGGAQAVAALAYGTQTVPRVDKITGPGNAYVASAKRRVFGQVGIDMVAGASEILVIADAGANPDWVTLDLFSQAEHDELAQAIAALAYGTATIAAVDKICGPGNAYVAAAKRRVFGAVGIDMVAGASEILVIADGSANPDWIALDLFSQAEHDEMAQAILLTPDEALIERVHASAQRLILQMPRAPIIAASLAHRGALIRTRDLAEACDVVNRIAPEHLELAVADPDALLARIRHAGAIFLGHYASEALGDYCAGPNHVLPTGRTARFSSPLGVYDFQKRSSVLRLTKEAAQSLGPIASTLARGEGLLAHALSAEARLEEP
jgi:histidinol dehydrogenase